MGDYLTLTSSESDEWNSFIKQVNDADIYHTVEYCKLSENNGEGKATLFVYKEGENIIIYPYLLRRINNLELPALEQLNEELYDIVTPYGYGGPITNVKDRTKRLEIFVRFSSVFEEYCTKNMIVTEFVRFHPVTINYDYYHSVSPTHIRDTICIDLSEDETEIMDSFANKGRNRLKYAMKNGLTISHENINNLDIFMEQYYKTMEKNNANSYYFFSRDYFKDLASLLKDRMDLFAVRYEGNIIASAFFLHYNDHVAYHLTGSDKEFLKYAPYNLLIYYAACWYGKKGYKHLHLGGGYEGNQDELFRFKKTFTKKQPLRFYIGKKVYLPQIYERLTQNVDLPSDYFPLYRHPQIEHIVKEKV